MGLQSAVKEKTKAEIQEQINRLYRDIERGKANRREIAVSVRRAEARVKQLEAERDRAIY